MIIVFHKLTEMNYYSNFLKGDDSYITIPRKIKNNFFVIYRLEYLKFFRCNDVYDNKYKICKLYENTVSRL